MYPVGLTCRVGGRPNGGKDPFAKGETTHIIIITIIIIIIIIINHIVRC